MAYSTEQKLVCRKTSHRPSDTSLLIDQGEPCIPIVLWLNEERGHYINLHEHISVKGLLFTKAKHAIIWYPVGRKGASAQQELQKAHSLWNVRGSPHWSGFSGSSPFIIESITMCSGLLSLYGSFQLSNS